MRTFDQYRKLFPDFYAAVKTGHENAPVKNGAHGLDHDVTVAMLAVRIAPNKRTADKVFCAALLHSTDRQFGRWSTPGQKRDIDNAVVVTMRCHLKYLPENFFSDDEVEEIFQAALRHAELNQYDQSMTQQVLMDADRLANLQMAVVLRAAAHQHHRPALELQWLGSVPKTRQSTGGDVRRPNPVAQKKKFRAPLPTQNCQGFLSAFPKAQESTPDSFSSTTARRLARQRTLHNAHHHTET